MLESYFQVNPCNFEKKFVQDLREKQDKNQEEGK